MFGDMGKMMKQVSEMKSKMGAIDKELKSLVVKGSSPDGKVTIELTGKMQLKDVQIEGNDELAKQVKGALTDALNQASETAASKLKNMTGMDIPGLT